MNFEHELETLRENMDAMGKGIQQAFADLLSAIALNDLEELDRIQKNDRKINEMERKIEAECRLLLTRQQPVLASDLRIVSSVMKAVGDMERIGDHAADIADMAVRLNGISYKEFTASDSNDIGSVVQSATEYADVIYIPTDNTMAQNTEAINNIALPAGTPIIAGEEGICKGCGVATLSISYYDIGKKAGEMAYDILVNGADITTMKIETAPNVTKEYNKDICDQLGVKIPDDYKAIEAE